MFFHVGVGLMGLAVVPHGSDYPGDRLMLGCQLSFCSAVRCQTRVDKRWPAACPQRTGKPWPAGCHLDVLPPLPDLCPQLSLAFHYEATFLSQHYFSDSSRRPISRMTSGFELSALAPFQSSKRLCSAVYWIWPYR